MDNIHILYILTEDHTICKLRPSCVDRELVIIIKQELRIAQTQFVPRKKGNIIVEKMRTGTKFPTWKR